jgi:hypothetical protein
VILQNTADELEFGFDYYDQNGNAVNFQNADLTANLTIEGTVINTGTQKPETETILSSSSNAISAALATMNPPTIKTSEDTITIPRSSLNIQGVTKNTVMIEVVIIGTSNPPFGAVEEFDISTVQLAQ